MKVVKSCINMKLDNSTKMGMGPISKGVKQRKKFKIIL